MRQPNLRALLAQYVAGTINGEDRQQLFEMLRAPEYQEELEQLLDEGFRNEAIAGLSDPAKADQLFAQVMHTVADQRPMRKMRWWAYAAAVLVLITAGIFLWPGPQQVQVVQDIQPGFSKATLTLADGSVVQLDSVGDLHLQQGNTSIQQQNGQISYAAGDHSIGLSFNTLAIPRGGQFHLTLPDGSRVWLNSASSLRYPVSFNGEERKVELQGQAYFEIADNAAQPFKVVTADGTEVQVLGTHFDVMAYADEPHSRTTLLQGAVRVSKSGRSKVLQPGFQATATAGSLTVTESDVQQAIAWKTGFFEFTGTPLTVILRQLERWYDVDVTYQADYPSLTFSGRFSKELPLSQVLHLLEENGVRFRIEGKQLIVLPK